MNCPVCNRTLAPTLSICLTCGAMMNDSVREELQTKIGIPVPRREMAPPPPVVPVASAETQVETAKREIPRPEPPLKRITNPLNGAKTSATLVGFQSKNAALPDWRLQLQNSVRQRKVGGSRTDIEINGTPTRLVTQGANALKAEVVEEVRSEPVSYADPRIENALKRIDQSRKTFLPEKKPARQTRTAAARSYPFNVVAPNRSVPTPRSEKPVMSEPPKPSLVPTFKIEKKKFDTNKLPPMVEKPAAESELLPVVERPEVPIAPPKPDISIYATKPERAEPEIAVADEIEDLAPVSMRFNAGLFDLMIGAFGTFALVSPFVLMGADWFTVSGAAAFVGASGFVMFMYMTIGLGMYGKTLGLRMFGLEWIDAEASDYPTFHQAAVNSAVFLLTLPVLGAGFIPMIFNEERRAFHDLAAGTIIVTEF